MIRANCRKQFTEADFEFIANTLAKDKKNKQALLTELLSDPEALDLILDDEDLLEAILRNQQLARISPFLYFYVLTRRVFLHHALDDRALADYVACLLAKFSSAHRAHSVSGAHDKEYHYLVDMMQDAVDASSFDAFMLRSHIGNYALFMTGIFPEYIYRRSTYGRKAPGFEYYEQMGQSNYRLAAQHKIALAYSLAEILIMLAERFRTVRIALNQLADEYIRIDTRPPGLDKMLRQIFYGRGPRQPN